LLQAATYKSICCDGAHICCSNTHICFANKPAAYPNVDTNCNTQSNFNRHAHANVFRDTTPNTCVVVYYMQLGMLERGAYGLLPF
jgi:hypothetical protein